MITKVYLYENTQSGGFQKFCISNSIMKRTIRVRTAPVRSKPGILSSSSEYGRLTQGRSRKRVDFSSTRSRSGMKSRYRAGTARPQRVESSGKVLPAQRWFCSCKPSRPRALSAHPATLVGFSRASLTAHEVRLSAHLPVLCGPRRASGAQNRACLRFNFFRLYSMSRGTPSTWYDCAGSSAHTLR